MSRFDKNPHPKTMSRNKINRPTIFPGIWLTTHSLEVTVIGNVSFVFLRLFCQMKNNLDQEQSSGRQVATLLAN